jgi:8-oxo-dGTP pyrophosphatase MutT (NUDIX family)
MRKRHNVIPRSLTIIFNKNKSKLLLIKGQPKKIHWANTYNALGGHIEAGENIHTSALREVKEESGITLQKDQLRLAGLIHVKDYNNDYAIMFLFMTTIDDVKFKSSDEGKVEWISINQLEFKTIAPDVKILVSSCKKLNNNEIIFGTSIFNTNRSLKKFEIDIYPIK